MICIEDELYFDNFMHFLLVNSITLNRKKAVATYDETSEKSNYMIEHDDIKIEVIHNSYFGNTIDILDSNSNQMSISKTFRKR